MIIPINGLKGEYILKIAFVHPALMDYRINLFDQLNNAYDITFIFTNQGRGQADIKEIHLKFPQEWNCKIVRSDKLVIGGRHVIMTYLRLIIELLRGKYDCILTSTKWYACFPIAKITGKKFIFWTEIWEFPHSSSFIRRLLHRYTRFIVKQADAIIATGTKTYEFNLSLGAPDEKIFKYPQCAIDYSKTPIDGLREELGLEDKKIVLCLTRMIREKGVDYLIKSFSLLEKEMGNVFLIVAGDGPYLNECKDLAKKLGVKNIHYTGLVDSVYKKVYLYRACDVFVLPSIYFCGRYEAWGLVINEAMAFGKPIVTTDAVGAAFDMVKVDYNGYVVENKNIKELYEALLKILSNPELARIMGENSRKMFEEVNDYKKMFEEFRKAIDYVQK